MRWHIPFTKTSGALRSQYQQWSIPKAIRAELGIIDGDYWAFLISHGEYSNSVECKITSGGEFRLPRSIAESLQRIANIEPESSVTFAIGIDDEAQAVRVAFETEVAASAKLKQVERLARLEKASHKPAARKVETTIYDRNPDVVAEVLYRAQGRCESCGDQAPFFRRSDGSPYLEVHHTIQIAEGGDDTVANAEALCPNCHRQAHYGIQEAEQ